MGGSTGQAEEDPDFLSRQLITYIGNKRALLSFIGDGLEIVRSRLGKEKLDSFDVFSGSGAVSRYLKRYSRRLVVNDAENYARVINQCYLTNRLALDGAELDYWFAWLEDRLGDDQLERGFIAELYAPRDLDAIQSGERCFYTPRNAMYLDTARALIGQLPESMQPYFLAPLLSEASVHANTSGVFKGFYKNTDTGEGQFGGDNRDALTRILGEIRIQKPVLSRFDSEVEIHMGDSNAVVHLVDEVDVAYIDPPYNQHPYGSNYFMLNLIAENRRPSSVSPVSGIPSDWFRSDYNRKQSAWEALSNLIRAVKAKYLLISFNSEGFISLGEMLELLGSVGKTEVLETRYNTFRGSRNLSGRSIHVREYLYLVEKS